jgi:hypothetical protein
VAVVTQGKLTMEEQVLVYLGGDLLDTLASWQPDVQQTMNDYLPEITRDGMLRDDIVLQGSARIRIYTVVGQVFQKEFISK